MTSVQYEELCRRWLANQFGLCPEDVRSEKISNPQRPSLPAYDHQVDLSWKTGNASALYLNIANAKWRGADKVDQGEILLLQQVRQSIAAHKAFMITNTGFTAGAIAAAQDHGIALHVVSPTIDASGLPAQDRAAIQAALSEIAGPLYQHEIVHRGVDIVEGASMPSHSPGAPTTRPASMPSVQTTAIPAAPVNRSIGSSPHHGNLEGGRGFGPATKK